MAGTAKRYHAIEIALRDFRDFGAELLPELPQRLQIALSRRLKQSAEALNLPEDWRPTGNTGEGG